MTEGTRLQSAIAPEVIREAGVTRLLASTSPMGDGPFARQIPLELTGQVQASIYQGSVVWNGAGEASWAVEAPAAGDYDVAVSYMSKVPGTAYAVSAGESSLVGQTSTVEGFFSQWGIDYQRAPLVGTLHLQEGRNEVRVSLPEGGSADDLLHLRAVELAPVSTRADRESEHRRALDARASTDWLADSPYGVMFTWDAKTQPRHGTQKDFATAVDDFDIAKFTELVERTGASHVLFSYHHALPGSPAPIPAWERAHPGWTTKRDLIAEMIESLSAKGIDLMLYFASHITGKWTEVGQQEFTDLNCELLSAVGERYGTAVRGTWLDGWYQCDQTYPDFDYEALFQACKAGNPERISALNSWIYPLVTDWQEYWAGENSSPGTPPTGQRIEVGSGQGLQYHTLFVMEPEWIHDQPDTEITPPLHTADALIDYVEACRKNRGALTINLSCYQDGVTVREDSLELMEQLRRATRDR